MEIKTNNDDDEEETKDREKSSRNAFIERYRICVYVLGFVCVRVCVCVCAS